MNYPDSTNLNDLSILIKQASTEKTERLKFINESQEIYSLSNEQLELLISLEEQDNSKTRKNALAAEEIKKQIKK